jgi:hypothetical protein
MQISEHFLFLRRHLRREQVLLGIHAGAGGSNLLIEALPGSRELDFQLRAFEMLPSENARFDFEGHTFELVAAKMLSDAA